MSITKLFILVVLYPSVFLLGVAAQPNNVSQMYTSQLTISPVPAYFGAIPLGSSANRDIIIYNVSAENVTINSIGIAGPQKNDFQIIEQIGTFTLGPLEQLVLRIRFTPSVEGEEVATLVVNSTVGVDTDSLLGTGTRIRNGVITFERIFGGLDSDGANAMVEVPDGGFAIVGQTISDPDLDYFDIYLIKTDAYGAIEWTQFYGGDENEAGYAIRRTPDGGFIIAGYTDSYGAGSSDAYLIKTDDQGDVLWTKTFGGNKDDIFYDIIVTDDGGFLAAGSTIGADGRNRDAYLVKINSSGDEIWSHMYGESSGGEIAYSIIQTSDGGYAFVGSTTSLGSGGFDVFLVKLNSTGVEQWHQVYGGSEWEEGFCVQETIDHGFIITGYTASKGAGARDVYLIKTDSNGNLQWDKTFGFINNDGGNAVWQDTDGGYIIAGSTVTEITQQNQYTDAYIIKTDADGQLLWSQLLGGDKSENFTDISVLNNGYIFAGTTSSYSKNNDVYLVRTNFDGLITKILPHPVENVISVFQLKQNYPNPFNNETIIEYYIPVPGYSSLVIFNVLGQPLHTLANGFQQSGWHQVRFDSKDLSSGIYYYQLQYTGKKLTRKMLLIR